ncbi:deoxyribodipyrimidine photo-lyase [Massilia sp. CFBP9012]|uniref:cryptochrome/photolyase family protein n=1 Tax=Massilia sp. CFBP9012 TaxID=3096531 RepID=UPI002A6A402E|nr:deoxyribodipyrimidine photo-lyase [Massilia sp. CFBP9012]MDY0974304.1 deoxyribodipyrimidine photo-lyase [Massilia sp. CFBP9012]
MNLSKSLVWFRRDLRAFDHAALHHALRCSQQVFCVFVYDTDILDGLSRDDRRLRFIHATLASLDEELRRLGGYLIVRHGSARDEVHALANELGVDAVHTCTDYEPAAIARDTEVAQQLAAQGRAFHSYKDQVIFEKDEVLTLAGQSYSVFTPYKNAWLKRLAARPETLAAYPVDAYAHAFAPPAAPSALPALEDIGFEAGEPPLPAGMEGAEALFEAFVEDIADYCRARDFPAEDGTSRLSTHLRFGTTSIRHLVRTAQQLMLSGAGGTGASVWLSELIWRDFYAMVLSQNPHVVERSFKPAFDAVQWDIGPDADALFTAWCEGRTGYPLVDAAMVQLNTTGFMHNRLRMVTASFLTKDLGIDWRRGESYFALTLNDYELASNNGGWQWAASTGCDAQPWFRIFNPVTQSTRFDARGEFIRRYLPQLAKLDAKQIHAPWLVKPEALAERGVVLGQDYPAPVVDHDAARRRTLERFAVVKKTVGVEGDAGDD